MRARDLLLAAGVVPWLAIPAAAQRPEGRIVLGGGSGTDIRGVRSAAYLVSPWLTLYPERASRIALNGRAMSFTTGEWAAGGGLGGFSRLPVTGPLSLQLSGAADATWTSYDVTFVTLEATPAVELRFGPASMFGGARAGSAWITAPDPSSLPIGGSTRETVTRSSFGPVFGAGVEVARFGPGEGVYLQYREDRAEIESVRVIDRQATARMVAGPVNLGATYGRRDAPDENTGFGGVQLLVGVTPLVAVMGSLEEYPSNRLTGALGGRTVSGGIALRFGGPWRPRPLPSPSGVAPPPAGVTRITIKAPEASRVELAGDWNDWRPEPARRAANGVWYVDLRLQPGDYRYAFRIDGKRWAVPEGVSAVDDGFGGKSAWVTVKGAEGAEGAQAAEGQEAGSNLNLEDP